MTELLAPAGSLEALTAAISNGADAVYLGMNRFGARAYANNFSLEELQNAIAYAHLRNVKLYVTMNTIVYDAELDDAYRQIDELYKIGADGIIVQDLALFTYIVKNYPKMEAHCSTQMGIDDLEGTLLFKSMGAKRVVLSREVPAEKIKQIKAIAKIPVEVFIHGALCVSYSGNCLMSGLIGYRSGNRGRCVGSCRKPYELINTTENKTISKSYILSMKDLNTIDKINQLKFADSLKIEGRMKEPAYVANVVAAYRKALDNTLTQEDSFNLQKTFNRTFTKGYLFKEDRGQIANTERPNNFGYEIGKVARKTKKGYELLLSRELNQHDIIRIAHNQEDISLCAAKIYDANDNLISSANKSCYIRIKEELSPGDIVYKTKDYKFNLALEGSYPKEYRRFDLNVSVYGDIGSVLSITLECEQKSVTIESDFILEPARKAPTTQDQFFRQFNRLNDTVYRLASLDYVVGNVFIPSAKINELRRHGIDLLNKKRTEGRTALAIKQPVYEPLFFPVKQPTLAVYCITEEQYRAAKELNISEIYYKDNIIRRNETKYPEKSGSLLIGGYGGIYAYKDTNSFITDYSLNAVNYKTVYLLHQLGAKRVTLSYEMNQEQIKGLIQNYYDTIGGYPCLEVIVYGRAPLMFTHYCPLKTAGQCGKCKKNEYVLKDEYGSFPILSHEDCTTTILNGKVLNLIDDIQSLSHIDTFRIQLTKETYAEAIKIIQTFQNKLSTMKPTRLFNSQTDTRGHFKREIL